MKKIASGYNHDPTAYIAASTTSDDLNNFISKPAPHIGPDGKIKPPIGTLGEQIDRALAPIPHLRPFSKTMQERILETLKQSPKFATEVAEQLGVRP